MVRRSSDVFAVRDSQVASALHFMASYSDKPIGVPEIVAVTEVSRQVLERRFRKEVGRTINEELIRLRVERLKRLLIDTRSPVTKLYLEAGFGTAAGMYATFKRLTGMTPVEFRERHSDIRPR